jgi:hypothetical protein
VQHEDSWPVPLAEEASSFMTIGHLQAGEELAGEAVAPAGATRPWPAAAAAAAAVIAIVAALVLIPALGADRPVHSPAFVLPPPASTLPPGVVAWAAWPAPPVTALPSARTAGNRSRLDVLKATLNFPGRLTLGVGVSYTVTLANPTRRPVVLRPCPSYSEGLAGAAIPVAYYYLNCGAKTSIPARGSVTFEMMATAPGQPGKISVTWHLQRTDVTAAARAIVVSGTPGGVVG